jgi:hypothetical protein
MSDGGNEKDGLLSGKNPVHPGHLKFVKGTERYVIRNYLFFLQGDFHK